MAAPAAPRRVLIQLRLFANTDDGPEVRGDAREILRPVQDGCPQLTYADALAACKPLAPNYDLDLFVGVKLSSKQSATDDDSLREALAVALYKVDEEMGSRIKIFAKEKPRALQMRVSIQGPTRAARLGAAPAAAAAQSVGLSNLHAQMLMAHQLAMQRQYGGYAFGGRPQQQPQQHHQQQQHVASGSFGVPPGGPGGPVQGSRGQRPSDGFGQY